MTQVSQLGSGRAASNLSLIKSFFSLPDKDTFFSLLFLAFLHPSLLSPNDCHTGFCGLSLLNWAGHPLYSPSSSPPSLSSPLPSPLDTFQVQVRAATQLGKWQHGALKFIPFSSDSRLGDHRPNSALTAPAWESRVWSL